MSKKTRPNEPCLCRSGKKFKKCCGGPGAVVLASGLGHSPADRASAFTKLARFIDEQWEEEEEDAFEEFWGRHLDREDEPPPDMLVTSRDVEETWFAFDHRLDDGSRIVDSFLAQANLRPGERSFLSAMRQSCMRMYEVTDTVPGSSMTLRDLLDGTVVEVNERSGSRSIARHECLATRVIPRGCSGGPEWRRACSTSRGSGATPPWRR